MKEKQAYIFFNCDEDKSQKSMNVFYNREIYRDLKVARKALLHKIEEELSRGRIQIAAGSKDIVRHAILEGEPTDATPYIRYGAIESFPLL